jgi:hypothetical protein
MMEVKRWETDLGLTRSEILDLIAAVTAGKRDGPPRSLRYFTDAMRRLAADKARPPLQPNDHHEGQTYGKSQQRGDQSVVVNINSAVGARRRNSGGGQPSGKAARLMAGAERSEAHLPQERGDWT